MSLPLIPQAHSDPIDDDLVAEIVDLIRAIGHGARATSEGARLVALCVPELLEELLTYRRLIGEQYAAVVDADTIADTDPRVVRFPTRLRCLPCHPREGGVEEGGAA
jgi:hypothetical protein